MKLESKFPYKDFNGKPYKFHEAYPTRKLAEKSVKHLHDYGDLARIVVEDHKYVVYWREK
jgi:hypothetical protein